jgi:pyruvate/2-oxoglutarate/acetoin dehydrogenase E1 component
MSAVRELTMVVALNEALHEEMARDASVLMIGEDIGESGGLFGVSAGLQTAFGPQRVIDSPISEAAIAGFGIGAALLGRRTVVEFQVVDFVSLAMDQIVNHAAKWRFMSGGRATVPVVFRGPTLSGTGVAAQHSQAVEGWFTGVPGLVVIAPSTPGDAKGLLKSAIRDDNPVVFIEKRLLYDRKGPVGGDADLVPIGKAEVRRAGRDVTIVGVLHGVNLALQAARELARDGIEAEVIDPRTLKPLDLGTIVESVERTGRLLVVTEEAPHGGFCADLVAQVCEVAFGALSAPPTRVTALDSPIPYSVALERAVLPTPQKVVAAARALVASASGKREELLSDRSYRDS